MRNPMRLIAAFVFLLFAHNGFSQLTWERMPGPPGGTGDVRTGTGGKLVLLGGSTGIYESGNGGQSWRRNFLPGSLHTESGFYFGSDAWMWYFDFDRVERSADNGRTWVEVENDSSLWTANDFLATLVLDTGSVMIGAKSTGIFRSTNLGKTIAQVYAPAGGLNALARNPFNGHLFAWKTTPVAGQINKIYRSSDTGLTWTVWENDPLTTGRTLNSLIFAANGTVFLNTDQILLRTTDDGASWTQLTLHAGDMTIMPSGRIIAEDSDGLFTISSVYSDDNGDTWTPLPTAHLMRNYAAAPDGTLFADFNFADLLRSTDDGLTWQYAALGMTSHRRLMNLHFYPDNAMLSITEMGVFYSPGNPETWEVQLETRDNNGGLLPVAEAAVLPDESIFVAFDSTLRRSTDRGETWTDITPAAAQTASFFNGVRQIDGVLFFTFYNGQTQTLRSEDGGQTWQDLGDVSVGKAVMGPDGTFWTINYASILHKSVNRGLTWTPVTTPSQLTFNYDLNVLPSGVLLIFSNGKVHRSANNGNSWITLNISAITDVYRSVVNSAGHVFVAGDQLHLSVDEGLTWQTVGRPNSNWGDHYLFLAPDDRLWYVAGDGVWRTTYPSTEILTISGLVRSDLDADCLSDGPEPPVPGILVKSVGPGGQVRYGYSNATGFYQALTGPGDFQVSTVAPNELWSACTLAVTVPTTQTSGNVSGKNLSIRPAASCPRLEIDVAAPLLRRCFDTRLAVRYRNTGTLPATNAKAEVVLDAYLDVLSTSLPVAAQSGDTLVFDLGNLPVNADGAFYIDVNVSCDATLGQMHCTTAKITPDTLCTSWQGAVYQTSLACDGDSVRVEIKNSGNSASATPQKWQLLRGVWNNWDSLLVAEALVSLQPGAVFVQKVPKDAADGVLLLKIPQEMGYPFGSGFAQTVLWGCDASNPSGQGFDYHVYEPSRAVYCQRNIGSYDPNDKTGFPEGIGQGHHIERTEPLDYLIRFQNTGTDTAFIVIIRDTLSALLDIETLQPGAASHPMQMTVRGTNEIVFRFDNILLPDSNINEAASHGFVRYSIRQKAGNADGEVIRNRAGIYFDFNEPVITNETWHTVGLPVVSGIKTALRPEPVSLYLHPNPFAENVVVTLENAREATPGSTLEITDPAGHLLLRQPFAGNRTDVQRNGLPAGLLLFVVRDADGRVVARGRGLAF